jgi:hypothetical protein
LGLSVGVSRHVVMECRIVGLEGVAGPWNAAHINIVSPSDLVVLSPSR